MGLFSDMRTRGYWLFDNNDPYTPSISPYEGAIDDLQKTLNVLIFNKLLIPKSVNNTTLTSSESVDDFISYIIENNYITQTSEIQIDGETIVFLNDQQETYFGMISITFRTFQRNITISLNSDVWLPLAFDNDKSAFSWNIDRYLFNKNRLSNVLKELAITLGWTNKNLLIREFTNIGCLQCGFEIFVNPEIIAEHSIEEGFSILEYQKEMEIAEKEIDNFF